MTWPLAIVWCCGLLLAAVVVIAVAAIWFDWTEKIAKIEESAVREELYRALCSMHEAFDVGGTVSSAENRALGRSDIALRNYRAWRAVCDQH